VKLFKNWRAIHWWCAGTGLGLIALELLFGSKEQAVRFGVMFVADAVLAKYMSDER
jgi:hypothetical protein